MRTATLIDGPLLRISGGRWRLSFVIPVLLLRCTGAKSGRIREVPLLYVPFNQQSTLRTAPDTGAQPYLQGLILIASNAGQAKPPAWYHNLLASESVEALVDRQWRRFGHRELSGEERDIAWQAALAMYPGYAHYAAQTARVIPVLLMYPLGLAVDQ